LALTLCRGGKLRNLGPALLNQGSGRLVSSSKLSGGFGDAKVEEEGNALGPELLFDNDVG
jgi:hypothetical protein